MAYLLANTGSILNAANADRLLVSAAYSAPIISINPNYGTATTSITLSGERSVFSTVSGVSGGTFGTVTYPTVSTWQMTVSALSEGDNTVIVRATLDGQTTDAQAPVHYSPDVTAPVTTCDRDSGAYLANTLITLTPSADYSNPVSTHYRVNGGDWTSYTAPVAITSAMTFEFYSVDAELNAETVQSRSYEIALVRRPDGTKGGVIKKLDGSPGGVIKRLVSGVWQ